MEEIEKLRLGDVGTIFRIGIIDEDGVVQLQACTEKKIIFKKPDGTYVEHDAEFYTNGADGYMQYTSVEGDLDQAGIWHIQGYIVLTNQGWHTTVDSFLVTENLEDA